MKQVLNIKLSGSLFNYLMANNETIPEVGKGATVLLYSDRHAYEVIEVSKDLKSVKIQRYAPKRIDANGMSDNQSYEYNELSSEVLNLVWYRNSWRIKTKTVVFTKEFNDIITERMNSGDTSLTHKERKELFSGGHLQLVPGLTREKTEYNKINIIFGVKREYYDYSF